MFRYYFGMNRGSVIACSSVLDDIERCFDRTAERRAIRRAVQRAAEWNAENAGGNVPHRPESKSEYWVVSIRLTV